MLSRQPMPKLMSRLSMLSVILILLIVLLRLGPRVMTSRWPGLSLSPMLWHPLPDRTVVCRSVVCRPLWLIASLPLVLTGTIVLQLGKCLLTSPAANMKLPCCMCKRPCLNLILIALLLVLSRCRSLRIFPCGTTIRCPVVFDREIVAL